MDPTEPPEDMKAFAQRVLAIVRELYPDRAATLSPDGGSVRVEGVEFGLGNVAAKFRLAGAQAGLLPALVRLHFDTHFRDDGELTGAITWGEAKTILLPQLMPRAFVRQVPLAHAPFLLEVLAGVVVDAEHGYRYVTKKDLADWGVSMEQALAVARNNLNERSQKLPIHAALTGDRMLAVKPEDGFAAARILLPQWREIAGGHLGFPFCFGVPCRDFLLCWAGDCSADTHARIRAQLADDFRQQPYPLSPHPFAMDESGRVRPVEG